MQSRAHLHWHIPVLAFILLCLGAAGPATAYATQPITLAITPDSLAIIDTVSGDTLLAPASLRYRVPDSATAVTYRNPYFYPTEYHSTGVGRRLAHLAVNPVDAGWAVAALNPAGFHVLLKRSVDTAFAVVGLYHHGEFRRLSWSPDGTHLLIAFDAPSGRSTAVILRVRDSTGSPVVKAAAWTSHAHWRLAESRPVWNMRRQIVELSLRRAREADRETLPESDSAMIYHLYFGPDRR